MPTTPIAARARFVPLLLLATACLAHAQDANIARSIDDLDRLLRAEPLVIARAEISRPKAAGDITLKADVSFGGEPPLRVKLRRAEPGGESFNNVPRYDLAAYALQQFFIEPREFPVPPTALRFVPLADLQRFAPQARATFPPAGQVLVVVQYWLQDVRVVADVYDPARFDADPVYARHIAQLNVLTHLIQHRDSNVGNFLIGKAELGPRVFSIDHGVAFASADADRGELWRDLRVTRLPADTVARLRTISRPQLDARLAVLAQWRLQDGEWRAETPSANLAPRRGVRRRDDVLQMGLTTREIDDVERLLARLLAHVDSGKLATFDDPAATSVPTP